MGSRGPLPDPRSERGARRRRPAPSSGGPTPPSDLTVEERVVWKEILDTMKGYRLLARCDAAALGRLCELTVLRRNAMRVVKELGPTRRVRAKSGTYDLPRPELRIAKQCGEELRQLENLLGLNPTARRRMAVAEQAPAPSAKDRYFFGGTA